MSFIKLISFLFYNSKVCFSDLAPNIIYSKTDECCPITYSSTWIVMDSCLRTLTHCLNKPDGTLQHFSRTVTRYCACKTVPQVQRELWTTFYPSVMDSWRVKDLILLRPVLHWWSCLSCSLLYIKTESGPLCLREQTLLRFTGEIKSLHPNPIERCGKEEHGMVLHDTTCCSHLLFSLPTVLRKLC